MTISKKILDEISNLETSKKFKQILITLLEIEDSGNYKKNTQFEKAIEEYVLNEEVE